jgi:cytochrome c-type biogenesis protein CcmH
MKNWMLLVMLCLSSAAMAGVEYRDFKQPEQEQVYQNLISELRCLVCQNQTIADSNADLAADLRRQVYEMVQQGQSKQQIVDFLTQRYGDFVLYKPAFKLKTLLLWLGPLLFLLAGGITIAMIVRRRRTTPATAIDAAQQEKLLALLERGDED